jgi:hypothetical protein
MSGVTSTGFVVATEAEIFEEIAAEARAAIAPSLDVSPDSVFGQIAGIVASKQAELWEVLEAVYGALSENASGASLDRIAAITGTLRKPGETDAQLRIRRRQELADAGQTTEPAIRAALSKLAGVSAVRVVSNRGLATDAAGRPGKSVECIVIGGADTDIAQAVWANLPAGIEAYGLVPMAVTDEEGNQQTVKFSRAAPQNLYVRVSAEVAEGSYAGHEALKETLASFTSGERTLELSNGNAIAGTTDIGGILYRSRLGAAALTVPGVVAVTRIEFRAAETDPWVDVDWPLGAREFLGAAADARGFQLDHIAVVTT